MDSRYIIIRDILHCKIIQFILTDGVLAPTQHGPHDEQCDRHPTLL